MSLALGMSLTAPEIVRKRGVADQIISATQFRFQAGGVSAQFNTALTTFILTANGRVKLKLWNHTTQAWTAESSWTTFFTTLSSGNVCVVSGLTVGNVYTPYLKIQANEAGYVDRDWWNWGFTQYTQPAKNDPPEDDEYVGV